jgi:hypothetical protein
LKTVKAQIDELFEREMRGEAQRAAADASAARTSEPNGDPLAVRREKVSLS